MADDEDERPVRRHDAVSAGIMHPLHAVIGAFPLAYFLAALISDYEYTTEGNIFWSGMASWMIFGGLVFAGISIVLGLIDWFVRRRSGGNYGMAWHALATFAAFVLGVIDAMVHSRDGWTSVVPTGITLTAIVFILLLVGSFVPAIESTRQREIRA